MKMQSINKENPFNDPEFIDFMEEQVVDGWKDTLDGFRDESVFVPQHKEAFYATDNEETIKRLVLKFEKKFGKKLKYRKKTLFYVSYVETVVGDEYDKTILNKHVE